jgi:periplasmic divalent cation tolerance protein
LLLRRSTAIIKKEECSEKRRMRNLSDYRVVFVTVPDIEEGRKIALVLLEKKLAACVSILPGLESHYWWQGAIEKSRECLLLIKTTLSMAEELVVTVKKLHSYSVPEIVFCPILEGNEDYLRWISDTLAVPPRQKTDCQTSSAGFRGGCPLEATKDI